MHVFYGFLIVVLSTFCISNELMAADRITGKPFATRSEVLATQGMAATSQPLATQVALDILKAGGNAVDAAIAANACLGLMEPVGNGIGGDLFVIGWDASEGGDGLYGLNGSGRTAKGTSYEEMKAHLAAEGLDKIPFLGPLSVSVPGAVDGWFALHARYGKLPMNEVLAPAIRYAEEGFPVTELIAFYWNRSVPRLSQYPGFNDTFTVDGERAPQEGEIWRNPALANTLRALAEGGRDAFYTGERAESMAAFLEAHGSFLRYEDFASHHSEWVDPVSTSYRGYDLWELPPNGQGIAALQILNILEPYDLAGMGWGSTEYVHHFVEAKKLAFEDRAKFYADMDFAEVPVERLISKEYAAERRALLDPARASKKYPAGAAIMQSGDTIYLCTADAEGNMVSLIQSNYAGMGSGVCPPGMGFGFQNRGTSFTMEAGHANQYEPGKRPFHTIIPAFVTKDGKPVMAYGVMGGATQPQMHAQILIHLFDFGMNLQEAGDAPRILHSGSSQPTGEVMTDGGYISLESGFPVETVRELQLMGHDVRWDVGPYGGYQAIWRNAETGVYHGASESRKDGQAAGF
jgi:gamma-glutamyltranspeptidase/glutathione hydrolase